MNSSRRSSTNAKLAPVARAFFRAASRSSRWPRSPIIAITSQPPYVSFSQGMMMEVSRPPEYASTTFFGNSVSLVEQREQNRFLHVQAIFRLVEDDGALGIHHPVGDFRAAVRRQAVHEDGVRRGLREERVIHLISREGRLARRGFFLLPHAGPDVGVNRLCARDGFFGRAQDFDFAARLARHASRFGDNGCVRLESGGRSDSNMSSQARADGQQRV